MATSNTLLEALRTTVRRSSPEEGEGLVILANFEIDIFSEPRWGVGLGEYFPVDAAPDLIRYDEQLIKPALLFASKVKLITYREDIRLNLVGRMTQQSFMPMPMFFSLVSLAKSGTEDDFKRAGLRPSDVLTESEIQTVETLRNAPKSQKVDLEPLYALMSKYAEATIRASDFLTTELRAAHVALDAKLLDAAIRAGILEVSPWSALTDLMDLAFMPDDAFFDASIESMLIRLASTERSILLDSGALMFTGNEYQSLRQDRELKGRDIETQVATALCGYLPSLERLDITEILDLRSSLQSHLPVFRQEVARLSDDINSAGAIMSRRDITAEIDRRWTREIDPVLSEIRQEVARASLPRQFLRAFSQEKDVLASTASSVVLAAGSVAAGLSTLIPAMAAASYPLVKILNEYIEARDEIKKNRLYFLHAAEHRIRDKSRRLRSRK